MQVTSGPVYGSLAQQLGTNMLGYYTLPNVNGEAHIGGAQAAAQEGSVLIVKEQTPVQMNILPERLFTATAIFRIRNSLTEPQIRELTRAPAAVAKIAVLKERPGPSLDCVYSKNVPSAMIGRDCAAWQPALGKRGFYSIVENKLGRYDAEHYLVVHTSNDQISDDIYRMVQHKITKPTPVSFSMKQFINSTAYHNGKTLALRNASWLGKEIAGALGLEIEEVVDRLALPKLDLVTEQPAAPTMGQAIGVTLFNHLQPAQYQAEGSALTYPAVAVYAGCCHPGSGTGSPILPLNPHDGMLWLSNFKSEYATTQHMSPAMLGMTLPCGTGHDNGSRSLDRSASRYVELCLTSNFGESIDVNHPKIVRNYRSPASPVQKLQKAFPENQPVILQHLFSTV